jgi:hypothetical protein
MDLSEEFYDRLLHKKDIHHRRSENWTQYPPKEVFLKMVRGLICLLLLLSFSSTNVPVAKNGQRGRLSI